MSFPIPEHNVQSLPIDNFLERSHKHKKKQIIRKKIKKHRRRQIPTLQTQLGNTAQSYQVKNLLYSLNTFENSDSDEVQSPIAQNNENPLFRLYSVLGIDIETKAICDALNITPFPLENEWRVDKIKTTHPEAASYTQLILCLTDPDSSNLDFQRDFILTFPSFASPTRVLASIYSRYFSDIKIEKSNITSPSKLKSVQNRVIRIISSLWLKTAPYQFTQEMYASLDLFSDFLNETSSAQAAVLKLSIKKVQEDQVKTSTRGAYNPEPFEGPPPNIPIEEWSFYNIPAIEIARQLTIFHNTLFMNILPGELLNGIWGPPKSGLSPTIDALIKHFDGFCMKVSLTVINGPDPHSRGRMIKKWIDVAYNCFEMKNYHAMFAIMYGITHKSVTRLYDTQKYANRTNKIRKANFEKLKNLCEPTNDFKPYRNEIEKVVNPCVPFMGCFQKDLVYVQEYYPNQIDGLINFKKCSACAKLLNFVSNLRAWYHITENPNIINLIRDVPTFYDTVEAMKLSMLKEKPKK